MRTETTKRRSDGATKGFTLVEMVIVIGIIVLLAALTLSVSVAVVESSEIRRTENTIKILTTAMQEWEAVADRQITYGVDGLPYGDEVYEIKPDQVATEQEATDWLMAIISRPASVRQILAQIDPDAVEQVDDFVDPVTGSVLPTIRVKDAWDNQIVAVFPGRTWVDVDPVADRDDDGTIRTDLEKRRAVAVNRQICFISAGPDGSFGDFMGDEDALDETDDNIFSYEPAERSVSAP
jgi:prepilin-type N-terminal cleavage/methylation domain-containing protein